MPAKLLSRSLIADIHQNRSDDCLEIIGLDPEEHDLPALGQLLSDALQHTTRLAVLELTALNPAVATVISTALKNPHCQLKGLVLKRMDKAAVTEISTGLRAGPARGLTIIEAGLTNSTSHAVYISLSHCHFQCTDRSQEWLQRIDAVDLLAPLATKPLMDFSLLMPAPRSYPLSSTSSIRAQASHISPWIEDPSVTPTTGERALAHLSLSDEDDCVDLSRYVGRFSPATPGTTKFIQSPAHTANSQIGRLPFSSPSSPSVDALLCPRARLPLSASSMIDRASESRYATFGRDPLGLRFPGQLLCPPSSPAGPLATVMNRVLAPTQLDSPARTLLAFIPTVTASPGS